tara:strand:+ start:568 stop:978 length:411 start_codon:yes stop_codon:yes gene_type:complete
LADRVSLAARINNDLAGLFIPGNGSFGSTAWTVNRPPRGDQTPKISNATSRQCGGSLPHDLFADVVGIGHQSRRTQQVSGLLDPPGFVCLLPSFFIIINQHLINYRTVDLLIINSQHVDSTVNFLEHLFRTQHHGS